MKTTVTESSSSFVRSAARPPRLRVIYTPGPGIDAVAEEHYLLPGVTLLGREPDGSAKLAFASDRRASRLHARLEVAEEDYATRLVDCGSRNGTLVNGQQLTGPVLLADGDLLRIGNSFLIFRCGAGTKRDASVPELIGVSPAACELRYQIARLACDRATVLVLGETGTGKEVVATALHRLSKRSGARVAVNCSAIPADLAESQFFGHKKGAFTGATENPGFFRSAHGGTLFLDEIGDIPLPLQPKLLRALEGHEVMPVGSSETIPCDVRVIAATNRDLEEAVAARQFREDLYARLSDVILRLPPLRERIEDVLLLLRHASEGNLELEPDLVALLLSYRWPRNVREVGKIASHYRLFGPDEALRQRLLPPAPAPAPASAAGSSAPPRMAPTAAAAPASESAGATPRETPRRPPPSREELIELMKRHGGVIQEIAEEMGCSRRQVGRWLEQHGIDREQYRS